MEGRRIVERAGVERAGIGLVDFAERRAHAVRAAIADGVAAIRCFRMKLAGYAVTPLDRVPRNPMKPSAAKPASNIAQVEGSGTGEVSDKLSRKP
jgi:hypothetical protein